MFPCIGAALLLLQAAQPAAGSGFEALDGRFAVHGFYETQIRAIARDFDASDDWDLTQLAHVLNLEFEWELAPMGIGPLDRVDAFARVEVRYDCIWSHACGVFSSADAYGDRADHQPGRLQDGRRSGYIGHLRNFDFRPYRGENPRIFAFTGRFAPVRGRRTFPISQTPAFFTLFTAPGPDAVFGSADDTGPFVFERYLGGGHCRFGARQTPGPEGGTQTWNLGPYDPACFVQPNAAAIDKPNPFRGPTDFFGNVRADGGDLNPITMSTGSGDLPYRPAPELSFQDRGPQHVARGLWIPNAGVARAMRKGEIDHFGGNFREAELAWNRGQSQQDEKELKELYVDLEVIDSRLWLRVGKQAIVWGKTELFRNQDQFNPQDFALSSLPSLEESRIALWAVRGVWSFWDVGPLEDVRLELAVNYDQFESGDFGRCGEPYSVVLVCAGYFGFLAHGLTQIGLAGVSTPEAPWHGVEAIELGGRVEWRWDRFSFALTDFWGYSDFPYVDRIFSYSRNVDPVSGRPRRAESSGPCRLGTEPACLGPGRDALLDHSANQTVFASSCAALIGLVTLDPGSCGNQIFNSQLSFVTRQIAPNPENSPTFSALLSNLHAGNVTATAIATGAPGSIFLPTVALTVDPCDGFLSDCTTADDGSGGINRPNPFFTSTPTLNQTLTQQQKALLGCGEFFGTNCELHGIDLLNMEASAFIQSFPGIAGTFGDWDTRDASVAQPGTVGFAEHPVCTRFEGGTLSVLPGCRAPGDSGYDVTLDGSPGAAVHPFTGQPFANEMAVVSFNALLVLAGLSLPPDNEPPRFIGGRPGNGAIDRPPYDDEFDATDPFRSDACSLAKPQFCKNFEAFFRSLRVQRNTLRAGGNGRFGRRDFQWHEGASVLLRFERANVLGFAMDFAEDRSKSNWSLELTWVNDVLLADNDEEDGLREVDPWNLTISVDRPTFVNFLNPNRTFFINSQWFIQYVDGYRNSFPSNGPWNVLATFTVTTGYFQDRLQPAVTFVWDLRSHSGAFLPQTTYRFTENFSATFGAALFAGSVQRVPMAINPIASTNRVGPTGVAYSDTAENGLSVVRERDEVFMRIKYTF